MARILRVSSAKVFEFDEGKGLIFPIKDWADKLPKLKSIKVPDKKNFMLSD
jgi:hypothetical protein